MRNSLNHQSGSTAIILAIIVSVVMGALGTSTLSRLYFKEKEVLRQEAKRVADDSAAYATEFTAKKIATFSLIRDSQGHWQNSDGGMLPGDANSDGIVDGGDYTTWADHYLQHVSGGPTEGDFNGDGIVDGADYTRWADNYLKTRTGHIVLGQNGNQAQLIAPQDCDPRFLNSSDQALVFSGGASGRMALQSQCKKASATVEVVSNNIGDRARAVIAGNTFHDPNEPSSVKRKVTSRFTALFSSKCRGVVSDEPLRWLYRTFLGREPGLAEIGDTDSAYPLLLLKDGTSVDFGIRRLAGLSPTPANENATIRQMETDLLNSKEFEDRGGVEGLQVTTLYRTIAGQLTPSPDADFMQRVSDLQSGAITLSQLAVQMRDEFDLPPSENQVAESLNQVAESFQKILGRLPDETSVLEIPPNRCQYDPTNPTPEYFSEKECWTKKLQYGSATVQSLEASLRSTNPNSEYAKNGGATSENVIALFKALLERFPDFENDLESFYPNAMALANVGASTAWVSQSLRSTDPTATEFMNYQGCPTAPPPPRCSLTASSSEIRPGENVTFNLVPYGALTSYQWKGPGWDDPEVTVQSDTGIPDAKSYTATQFDAGMTLTSIATVEGPGGPGECRVDVHVSNRQSCLVYQRRRGPDWWKKNKPYCDGGSMDVDNSTGVPVWRNLFYPSRRHPWYQEWEVFIPAPPAPGEPGSPFTWSCMLETNTNSGSAGCGWEFDSNRRAEFPSVKQGNYDPCNRVEVEPVNMCGNEPGQCAQSYSEMPMQYTHTDGYAYRLGFTPYQQGGVIQDTEDCKAVLGGQISPLVLNLSGEGVSISPPNRGTFFKLAPQVAGWTKDFPYQIENMSSFIHGRELFAWPVNGYDVSHHPFLVYDLNANGIIEDYKELFGNEIDFILDAEHDGGPGKRNSQLIYENGFEKLKMHDSNNDNFINSSDSNFSNLKLWYDRDMDGISDSGELQTLSAAGIESIDLDYVEAVEFADKYGSMSRQRSVVNMQNGETYPIYDLWFAPGNKVDPNAVQDGQEHPGG